MDAVRCPPRLVSSRLKRIIGLFYDHLARLIYAEAARWKPTHLAQLRDYVDRERRGYYVEGYAVEYIMPNWAAYSRESGLYAVVEASQDGELALAFLQGRRRAGERPVPPFDQLGHRDIRFPVDDLQWLATQQTRHHRHLALNRIALRSCTDARGGACPSYGGALPCPLGVQPCINRHFETSGCVSLTAARCLS